MSFVDVVKSLPSAPPGDRNSDVLKEASAAIEAIKTMDLPKAQLAINKALQLDARNSYLHFLNGFVYHLEAKQGDTQKGEIAIEGYKQALRLDPSNWIAQEFLALAYMDMKQFDRAKKQFSEVLLMTPDSTVSIQGLMVASYLTGDAATACAMADQFLKTSAKPHLGFVRSSVPVYASCGKFDQAERMRAMLDNLGDDGADSQRLDKRVAQWRSFYQEHQHSVGPIKTSLTPEDHTDALPERLAQAFSLPDLSHRPEPSADVQPAEAADATPSALSKPSDTSYAAASQGPRMVLIDVVLLS
ncbi:MAG TPA: tetratricopeptide repeat protein, partial [Aquabacterium sp.]|nr:tetratricopeptide repeat protein [Aquabacterium sp.]